MVRTSASIKQKKDTAQSKSQGSIFKLAFVCPMYNSEVTTPASKFTRIQPMRLPYHPFGLVAQQVPNLPKETKGNSMLIPLFHSLPLCSPKKASKSYTMPTFALSLCKALCNSSSRCLQSKEGKFQALST